MLPMAVAQSSSGSTFVDDIMFSHNGNMAYHVFQSGWLGGLVARAFDLRLNGCKFETQAASAAG